MLACESPTYGCARDLGARLRAARVQLAVVGAAFDEVHGANLTRWAAGRRARRLAARGVAVAESGCDSDGGDDDEVLLAHVVALDHPAICACVARLRLERLDRLWRPAHPRCSPV